MKKAVCLFVGVFLSASAMADTVLVMKVGAKAHEGVISTCEIQSDHKGLKGVDVEKLIEKASKEAFEVTRVYVRANTPSVSIYANQKVSVGPHTPAFGTVALELVNDYSNRQERAGAEAAELIKLTEKLCPKP